MIFMELSELGSLGSFNGGVLGEFYWWYINWLGGCKGSHRCQNHGFWSMCIDTPVLK